MENMIDALFKSYSIGAGVSDVPLNRRVLTDYEVGLLDVQFEPIAKCASVFEAIDEAENGNIEWEEAEGRMPHPITWTLFPSDHPGFVMAGKTMGSTARNGDVADVVYLIRTA